MKTIVQEYGPIYGEPVNGTVLGRPNGSVFVPLTNVISMSVEAGYEYMTYDNATTLIFCKSDGTKSGSRYYVVAEAQDLSSYVRVSIYSDVDLTTVVASSSTVAGQYNFSARRINNAVEGIEDGDKLYAVAELMNNSTPVATANVVELTAVII